MIGVTKSTGFNCNACGHPLHVNLVRDLLCLNQECKDFGKSFGYERSPFARVQEAPVGGWTPYAPPMTLRDWFAGQALASAVDDYGQPEYGSTRGQRTDRGNPVLPYAGKAIGPREDIIARQAYRYADAMIAARDAKP